MHRSYSLKATTNTPVVGDVTGPVAAMGTFKEDQMSASVLGERQAEAVKIFDRAGWL